MAAEIEYEVWFRAISLQGNVLGEGSFVLVTEMFHNWDIDLTDDRTFFYPRFNLASFGFTLTNKGNTLDTFNISILMDGRLEFANENGSSTTFPVVLPPFSDTVMRFNVIYTANTDRVFDLCKVDINAELLGEIKRRAVLIEKYSDIYSPFYIDKNLPHQVEVGARTFSGNEEFLPFVKARGKTVFNNQSTLMYNINYYSVTGNEDFISNTYYTLLYNWQSLRIGIGAFSSQLGRNLYTRNGIMINNTVKLSPSFYMEAFASQSFYAPKTNAAIGYTIGANKKVSFMGSFAYDYDRDRSINTTSVMFRSSLIPINKSNNVSFNIYGYHESHYKTKEYVQSGVAWDIRYNGLIKERIALQLIHNYGSPDIPGPQMGLLNFNFKSVILLSQNEMSIGINYINGSRKYYNYTYEGERLPSSNLYDQYARISYNSTKNENHTFELGPSIEFYRSRMPITGVEGAFTVYESQKIRFEYKANIYRHLLLSLKAGLSNIHVEDITIFDDQRYDLHIQAGYNFKHGISLYLTYDNGPMVNTGLYQYSGDLNNQSLSLSPSVTTSFLKNRISLNLFSNVIYRIDLKYFSFNINPRIETFLFRDWYLTLGGTYHFTRQEYSQYTANTDYTYLEVSVQKRFGKSDFNKWQKDTRRLKIVLFQDENANGIKEDNERGVPYVKTRLKMTQSSSRNVSTEFPVDITLLSNEAGVVIFNRLPMGFYELAITPLSDVREYFYVSRSAEKIELSENQTYFIPFQKASKLMGKIEVKRAQFIKSGDEEINLKNIRITAYNDQGNSYSTFTLADGSFTIYVPGNMTYTVRMPNVFGDAFKILKNDIVVTLDNQPYTDLSFNVVESARQVKFKTAAAADTVQQAPLKIKVLHGKFYENRTDTLDKDAAPEFNIEFAPPEVQEMTPGNFYVVLREVASLEEATKYRQIVMENGVNAYVGFVKETEQYFVFSNYYKTQLEARKESDLVRRKPGMKDVYILKLEMEK